MNFLNRLKFYLIGFGLGLFLIYSLFKDREWDWIGEIIGGSQKEERYDVLEQKCKEFNVPKDAIWWYLETRKFGTVPHAGFGLGFERLMMFVTGMNNIRDVIPFPRTPNNAEF